MRVGHRDVHFKEPHSGSAKILLNEFIDFAQFFASSLIEDIESRNRPRLEKTRFAVLRPKSKTPLHIAVQGGSI